MIEYVRARPAESSSSQRSRIVIPPERPSVRTAPTPLPSSVQLSIIGPPHFATPPKSPSSAHTFAAGAAIDSLTLTSDMSPPSAPVLARGANGAYGGPKPLTSRTTALDPAFRSRAISSYSGDSAHARNAVSSRNESSTTLSRSHAP